MNLPKEITVIIHKTPEGLWAKVKEFPHCYTQADDYYGLVQMVNDAIRSYAGISKKGRKVFYLPKSVIQELERKEWGKLLEELKDRQSISTGRISEKYAIVGTAC